MLLHRSHIPGAAQYLLTIMMYSISTLPAPLRRLDLSPVVFAALFSLAFVAGLRLFLDNSTSRSSASAPLVHAGQAAPEDFSQYAAIPRMMEMHIANNGLALVRGARIESLGKNSVTVVAQWGSQTFQWSVEVAPDTKLLNGKGEALQRSLRVGDIVTISGELDTSEGSPTIAAKFIRVGHAR